MEGTRTLAIVLLLLGAARVEAMTARLRWLPSTDPRVVGYRVWVRAAGSPYGPPIDAGSPTPAADGTISWNVPNLADGATHHFSVTAYTAESLESGCSYELSLGAVDPCRLDRCCLASCSFGAAPDGTACGAADECHSCRAGVCAAGVMTDLLTRELTMAERPRGVRLQIIANLGASTPIRPTETGVVLDVTTPTGELLYRAHVPPGAMRGNRAGTYFAADPKAGIPGLRRLKLRVRSRVVRVGIFVIAPELASALDLPGLSWSLRLGGECSHEDGLSCIRKPRLVACR